MKARRRPLTLYHSRIGYGWRSGRKEKTSWLGTTFLLRRASIKSNLIPNEPFFISSIDYLSDVVHLLYCSKHQTKSRLHPNTTFTESIITHHLMDRIFFGDDRLVWLVYFFMHGPTHLNCVQLPTTFNRLDQVDYFKKIIIVTMMLIAQDVNM